MADTTGHVFISYSDRDRGTVLEILRLLEEQGVRCWIALRDIDPGKVLAEEIVRAIERARAVLLVLSSSANESPYVCNEVERAASNRKPVFCVRIEEVQPSKQIELFLFARHWLDAWSPPLAPKLQRLVAGIKGLASPRKSEQPDGGREAPPPSDACAEHGALTPNASSSRRGLAVPSPDGFVDSPGRRIDTGLSILRPVSDRQTNHRYLLKTTPKDHLDAPLTQLAHITVDDGEIVPSLLQWETEDAYGALLPFIDGWTLAEVMALNTGIYGEYLTKWCWVLLRLIRSLQQHSPPLLHLDLKPGNVMVRSNNLASLVLIDCTTVVPYPPLPDWALYGTRGYSSPECIARSPGLGSDVYSVGCTIYHLNRNQPPPSPVERQDFAAEMDLVHAEPEVSSVFSRMIALDPQERFPDATAVLSAWPRAQTTRKHRRIGELVLPDGRRLQQVGYFR